MNSAVSLTPDQWSAVLTQFEGSVFQLSKWLERAQVEKQKNQLEIAGLEEKISALRAENQNGTNVFEEIKLKSLLNRLKEKLEANSNLQHQWDDKQKDFEQKALSLISLYNDRIETELSSSGAAPGVTDLDTKLAFLGALVLKRNHVQLLLAEYGKMSDGEKLLTVTPLTSLKTHDRESLQLTIDLFRDRKRDLGEQLEKWSIEVEQTRNELKLQGKMQDFLEDIRQNNEDSDFPRGGLKRHDLEGVLGKGQRGKLESKITDLQAKITRAQRTLNQISLLMSKAQTQLDNLNERKRK